jgi:site-specific DNA recombinase
MNEATLWKVLTKRSGDMWEQKFRIRSEGVERTVPVQTRIPRLLAEDVIEKIRAKCAERRTYNRGNRVHDYLFSKIIFDAGTTSRKNGSTDNIALTGTTNRWGSRYYRPFRGQNEADPYKRYMINADVLEKAVIDTLFEALSANRTLYRAVFDGNPISEHVERLTKETAGYERELKSVEKQLSNADSAILAYSGDDIQGFLLRLKGKVQELEKRKIELKTKIEALKNQLRSLPTEREVNDKREWMKRQLIERIKRSYFSSGWTLQDLPFDDKQKLVRLIFGGRDESGKRYGIYVTPLEGRAGHKRYRFEAYGRLGNIDGWLESRTGEFWSDADNSVFTSQDADFAFKASKLLRNRDESYLSSERDAHHCLRVYQR